MADDDMMPVQLVYVGRRWMSNRLQHLFITEDQVGADPLTWSGYVYRKAPRHASVGVVYSVPMDATKAVYFGKAERVGTVDADQWRQWAVEDQAAVAAQESDRAAKRLREDRRDLGDITLRELAETMRNQPQYVQDGTLIVVLRYLTRGT